MSWGIVMQNKSTCDVHMRNDVMLQNIVLISDTRQSTCYMQKSRRTTMINSCPYHDNATTQTVDLLLHNVPLNVYNRHMGFHQHLTGETDIHLKINQSSTWHMSISSISYHSSTEWRGFNTLRRTGLLRKNIVSISQLRIIWSEICEV